ncbi:virulence factor SrfC family protein [Seohaeicola zhoushanensis]|uniref:Virulence factor n=1 Tax=Seohaeicola zhoushanensis TaxID=1569283 RepID=A0A8J3MB90_9RHOB|nr:virulence factor SrfC family protein [Seohaeicola zhoushanensis]GHF63559.1 virulence factor [Seohaeicola zhoushanensis]
MVTQDQQKLAADCAEVAEVTSQALAWVETPANAALIGAEARSLTQMMRKGLRRARRLAQAAEKPMSVSVFGPSQAGKSFLVSVLARPEGGRLVGDFPGRRLDYISEVNPEGEGESTGLVTRFTMRREPTPEGFPIKLTLLSEADIVRTIVNSFFNDGDESEVPPDAAELSAHLDAFKARAGAARPGLDADAVHEIGEYIESVFRKSAYAAALKPFWDEAAEIAPRLSASDRAGFFAILWGRHEALGALYQQLADALAQLDHSGTVHVTLDALTPREQSIIDVKTLAGLRGAPVGPALQVRTEAGRVVQMPRAELCALAAELVFPMAEQPSELFGRTDLLDFPGARNRFEEPLSKTLANLDKNLHELLLRGKVAYLFDRYVENQEITSMLLCVPGSNMETLDLPGLVDNWIALTHGRTPEQRAQTDNVLFFVLTKFDMQLADSAAEGGAVTRFERRMKASLLERFGRGSDGWVEEWAPNRPFDNCYWLRNPNYFVDGLIDYDDNRRELRLRPDKEARVAELREGCLAAEPVQRHFADPAAAWDAALALNDGGVTYLTDALARVCKPDSKLRQIRVQLDEIAGKLTQALAPFHVSDDVEQRIVEAQETVTRVIDDLEQALARHRFGAVLSALMVDQDEIEGRIARVPSSVRITSAVSAASADPTTGPARPGRPARPRPTGSDIRTMTLEQFQAETALEAWIDRLKAFRDDRALRAAWGITDSPAADLVTGLIHAARRTNLSRRTADEIAAVNFGLNVEKQAQPASIIGAEEINSFVATLGMRDLPASERPKVETPAGPRPVFTEAAGHDSVDSLPARALNVAEATWSDWVFALDALFVANAKDGAGGAIDIEQNLALGRILGALNGHGRA